jgi:outer membrane lipopolysaccharide assembly protein LptE/RlpB
MPARDTLKLLLAATLLLVASSCGYHTAGHAVRLPESVHTIAVPVFTNRTHIYKIEQTLTAGVVREFTSRSAYRVVSDPGAEADAVLNGTVIGISASPLTFDSVTGRASSMLITVAIDVRLVDRKGKMLYQNPNYVFRDEYQVSREISSFFEEQSPALDRLASDFSRTLVSNILEAY